MKTFSVQTLGCKVNQYEGEQLAAFLRARGLSPAGPREADLRVVHTCSVTVQAAGKSRQATRRATGISLPQLSSGPRATATALVPESGGESAGGGASPQRPRVVVTGCWATSDPQAAAALPGVDAVVANHEDVAAQLGRLLDAWQGDRQTPQEQPAIANGAGWIEKAGTAAGRLTSVNRPLNGPKVNEILADETRLPASSPPAPRAATFAAGATSLPLLGERQTGRQRAHLKVQDGCDAHCTYCIIPRLRPALWSKPIGQTVEEARRLVAAGHVELVLTGIFLGAYGQSTALRRRQPDGTAGAPLARLVDALCNQVPGLRRLRLSSLEPGDLTADLVAALAAHDQVVPHFHLPLQSGSDGLLRRMNRQYDRDDFLQMIDRVRRAFDRPALTTDIIVGFPGESDAEFDRTLEVVEHAGFIHVHAFSYSPRPGTAAARWIGASVHGSVVKGRIDRLRERAAAHSLSFRRQFLGETAELLVELENDSDEPGDHDEAGTASAKALRHGRCERYFAIHFDDPRPRPGDFVRVRIDRISAGQTFGARVDVA